MFDERTYVRFCDKSQRPTLCFAGFSVAFTFSLLPIAVCHIKFGHMFGVRTFGKRKEELRHDEPRAE